jgi:hypothetical protein
MGARRWLRPQRCYYAGSAGLKALAPTADGWGHLLGLIAGVSFFLQPHGAALYCDAAAGGVPIGFGCGSGFRGGPAPNSMLRSSRRARWRAEAVRDTSMEMFPPPLSMVAEGRGVGAAGSPALFRRRGGAVRDWPGIDLCKSTVWVSTNPTGVLSVSTPPFSRR